MNNNDNEKHDGLPADVASDSDCGKDADQNVTPQADSPEAEPAEQAVSRHPSFLKSFLGNFWQGLVVRQVLHKIITLVFALAVFSFTYMHMSSHRSVLTYMGVMLLMVLVYAEILVIRDHLWVIEGSMRESRKWRDVFFNQTNLRRQRMRKFLIVLFSMATFSYIIIKSEGRTHPLFAFMGLILMITVLYYEILSIRDEVLIMAQSISDNKAEQDIKPTHEKFLANQESVENKPASEQEADEQKNC